MDIFFSGSIERVIFENASNFFKIILLHISETNAKDYEEEEIIVTGTVADIAEGEDYTFFGELVQHPRYGQQLKITRYERAKPTAKGLIKYFSGNHFKGIGAKTAERIVTAYGSEETIDKILTQPEKLQNIQGMSKTTRENFLERLRANYGTEMILTQLAAYGIPNRLAFQIQDTYKEETLQIIQANPYQLVEDIQGLGFKIADRIAQALEIASDSPERFRAGLMHSLITKSMERGDTYLEAKDLLEATLLLLEEARQVEVAPDLIAAELLKLIEEGKVQQEGTRVFDNSLYFAEQGIHRHLTRLLDTGQHQTFSQKVIFREIAELEKELGIHYDELQREAIVQAINHQLFILTGGPGTGKTTIIKGIIAVYARLHQLDLQTNLEDCPILLAAPTGRAARRMYELTDLPAATIHRHLGLTGETPDEISYRNDYLDAQLIIVDEFSMVDTWLANQLFSHVAASTQIILVGDSDQLPSVSPGQVLADLIKIPELPHTRLEKIYRQDDGSTIITLASQIRVGQTPANLTEKQDDRSYFEARSEHIPQLVTQIVSAAIKSGIKSQDIQILAPMYRGQAGIDSLNQLMQNQLNPLPEGGLEFIYNQFVFRQSDKVIHLINDAENNVFNGDIGYITDLLPAKYTDSKQDELTISFEGAEMTYPRNEWYKITLAYAMSIHKSQGSEFPVVILPLTNASRRMLQRNLLYTAITRSKSKLILLGEYTAFNYAIQNTGTQRRTYLIERFSDQKDQNFEKSASLPNLEAGWTQPADETAAGSTTAQNPNYTASPSTEQPLLPNQAEPNASEAVSETGSYLLTPDNLLAIDPMIGVTEADILTFFGRQT